MAVVPPRSSRCLILIMFLAFGLGLWCWRPDFSHESARGRPDRPKNPAEKMAIADDGFRPIPLVAPPDDHFQPAIAARDPLAAPPSEAMRKLASQMSRESADLQIVTHPDGRRSVDLRGRFLHMSAVVTGADGKTEVRCFSNDQEMNDAGFNSQTLQVPVHAR